MLEGTLSQYALAVISGALPPILPYGALSDNGSLLPGPNAPVQIMLALTPGESVISDIAFTITHSYPEHDYPNTLDALAAYIKQPGFPTAL